MLFPENAVGRLIEPITVSLDRNNTVLEAIEILRPHAQQRQLAYTYVIDEQQQLLGVVTMRELLFANLADNIVDLMVTEPFYFTSATHIEEAMRAVLSRHYPMYPVCDEAGQFLGIVRGYALFEQQQYELTAQAGRMVGVEKEEHMSTPWRIMNGMLVGLTAGAAMLGYAILNGSAEPIILAGIVIVIVAMLGSCAGVAGVLIPLLLRRFGADPATASTILLTTATDVVSMGAMLGLATIILL